jgi:hypothetical protein
MATHFATIWRADDALARCNVCGVQRQFHGMSSVPTNVHDRPRDHAFEAETADDIDPADLRTDDLIRHCNQAASQERALPRNEHPTDEEWAEIDRLSARVDACRNELKARVKAVFGLTWDQLQQTVEG